MATEYALFPRTGSSIRAHSVFWQRMVAADAGYCGISGMDPTRASATQINVASGYWLNKSTKVTYAGGSISAIPAASAGQHRYDLIVMDGADSTLKRVAGTESVPTELAGFLNNITPKPPELSGLKQFLIAVILVDSTGVKNVNIGTYCVAGVADMRIMSPDFTNYASKVGSPVVGNAMGMDANGNPADSGIAFTGLARRAGTPVSGNICSMDSDGDPTNSNVPATVLTKGWLQ